MADTEVGKDDTVIVNNVSDSDEEVDPDLAHVNEEGKEEGEIDPSSPAHVPEYLTVEQKIESAMKEKNDGNDLFRQGKLEEAWKCYDRAFVNIFIGKEEWAALLDDERKKINDFKVPCHLNRGFCRLKLKNYADALWDFSEAARIDPENVKARYRKSVSRIELIKEEMKKEALGKFWDVEKQEEVAAEVRADLIFSIKKNPNDKLMRATLEELGGIDKSLHASKLKYRESQRQMFAGFLKRPTDEPDPDEVIDYSEMPPLEKISISDG